MQKTVAIIHYNTPALTYALVRSIWKHTPDCRVVVFDNSDKLPFPPTKGVEVITNCWGDVINFDALLERYPDKEPTCNNHASSKHIASVDYLFDALPAGFVLMDSDILIKKDITPFFDKRVVWSGTIEDKPLYWFMAKRVLPWLLWINVPMCKRNGIRFWHEGKSYKLSHSGVPFYDTGASFFEDCAALPHKELNIFDYMEHFVGASYRNVSYDEWLEQHEDLYK